MAKIIGQSEESKYIKRINEQLAEVSRLAKDDTENPLITAWSRAIRESGLEFSKEGMRYKIRNTKENQKKVEKLQRGISKYQPQTAGEYKKKIKKELKEEAKKTAKRFFPKDEKKQKAYIKKKLSRKEVSVRIKEHFEDISIESQLSYLYQALGSRDIGERLSALTKGIPAAKRNKRKILNEFGRISKAYRRELLESIQDDREITMNELASVIEANPFANEVQLNGKLGKNRKRKLKK